MQLTIPKLISANLIITVLSPSDYNLLATYERTNQAHLSQWEPLRATHYLDDQAVKNRVQKNYDNFIHGSSVSLVGLNKTGTQIIGVCNFSNIVYGAFQACHLGFSIDEKSQGRGLMFEMLKTSLDYVFSQFSLHRVMANYMPDNRRSEKLLTALGFEKEGMAKSYLKIAGSWQDHVLTSKINPNYHG